MELTSKTMTAMQGMVAQAADASSTKDKTLEVLKRMAKQEIEASIGNLTRINILQDKAKQLNDKRIGPVRHMQTRLGYSTSSLALMVYHKRHTVH